jgi:hypothetical protein
MIEEAQRHDEAFALVIGRAHQTASIRTGGRTRLGYADFAFHAIPGSTESSCRGLTVRSGFRVDSIIESGAIAPSPMGECSGSIHASERRGHNRATL